MATKEENLTPENTKNVLKTSISDENDGSKETLFTPRFRSVAAMAGWDEEALLLAALVVEDTPDRESKHKKRIKPHSKTPPTNSRRTKRVQRRSSPDPIPMVVLDLDNEEIVAEKDTERDKKKTDANAIEKNVVEGSRKDCDIKKIESNSDGINDNVTVGSGEPLAGRTSNDSSSSSALPCMNRLREELSCAICLDICFEPSTTSCGHSFCKKCLKSAADKCGKKCPKCRQLISNGRSCTVNTVLWNTIQLLFPQEVELRKAAETTKSCERTRKNHEKQIIDIINQSTRVPVVTSRDVNYGRRRRGLPSQAEDAALALRLQREEFMVEAIGGSREQERGSFTSASQVLGRASFASARENLRAMATRAVNHRARRA
ncbi:zinc finger (C3HC4-type RING finger) family protein [Thalictrum thalictroides]|uniref:RING-type E3 ubiquitin transferase n=1 Tax=Thalictrum thalictroides TaxID=46969 RepID=A0A7J6WMA8_THATH|nr:zinc finger (C3HC4-type RING finger) family protein [Thalictrum thalictroides]